MPCPLPYNILIILQQKLAKRDGGGIDRSQDIARLREFYKLYREKNRVDKMQEEEMLLRESGTFSGNLGEYVMRRGNYLYFRVVIHSFIHSSIFGVTLKLCSLLFSVTFKYSYILSLH